MLHQETRLADELVRPLRNDHRCAFAAIVDVWRVVIVDLGVFDDESILQNVIEARLNVIRVGLILVVFVFLSDDGRG